jgi:hypothetical protein
MRRALSFLRALFALPGLCRALAAEAEANRRALLADGWSPEAADAAARGELP